MTTLCDEWLMTHKPNPGNHLMLRRHGSGPEGKRCKHCAHIYRKEFAKNYYKCDLRGDTNGPGTDHRVNWPACGKFEERKL